MIAVLMLMAGVAGGLRLDEFQAGQISAYEVGQQLTTSLPLPAGAMSALGETLRETEDERALAVAARDRAAAEAALAAARAKAVEQEASRRGSGRTLNFGPIPASCDDYSGNRAIGCALVLAEGFSLDQFPCLEKLWTKESGWNHKARNVSSGAYGIPQSLPGEKMAEYGDDWQTNPATQIKWGLSYIEKRYGTPCNAWQHSQSNGWY